MPSQLQASGAQPQKNVRAGTLYTGRFFQGLYTNRSPLRMGGMTWLYEKFYGGQNDALIGGLNTEISNRLTLVRRPGNPVYTDPGISPVTMDSTSATFDDVTRFDSFHLLGPTTEDIAIMIDTIGTTGGDLPTLWTGLNSGGTRGTFPGGRAKQLVFQKSVAQQAFMESVGNILFFGDGAEQKKWINTINTWASLPTVPFSAGQYPYFTTTLVDSNFALQQLIATALTISDVTVDATGFIVTITVPARQIASTGIIGDVVPNGTPVFLQGLTTVTSLNGLSGYVTSASGTTVVLTLNTQATTHSNVADTGIMIMLDGGTPTKGGSQPTWAETAVTPSKTDWPYAFTGTAATDELTLDGTALWLNRSNAVSTNAAGIFNWGIKAPTIAPTSSASGGETWTANTFYSPDGVVVDSHSNIWGVQVAGLSGTSAADPFSGHATPTSGGVAFSGGTTVTDGTVTWMCVQAAAHLDHSTANPGTAWHAAYMWSSNFPFIVQTVSGMKYLMKIENFVQPTIAKATSSAGSRTSGAYGDYYFWDTSAVSNPGIWTWNGSSQTGATTGNATAHSSDATGAVDNSLVFNANSTGQPLVNNTLDASGAIIGTTTPWAGANQRYSAAFLVNINITQAAIDAGGGSAQIAITVNHDDGFFFGYDASHSAGTMALVSGATTNVPANCALNASYNALGGINQNGSVSGDGYVVSVSAAGPYIMEFDFFQWENSQDFQVQMNSFSPSPVDTGAGNTPLTMAVAPSFPPSNTSHAPGYPNVTEQALFGGFNTGGNYTWDTRGPIVARAKSTTYTLAGAFIVDGNDNIEAPFIAGVSGATLPTFTTSVGSTTNDATPLVWINDGPSATNPAGTLSALTGLKYGIALVNTIDNTVSNMGPFSVSTGMITAVASIELPPGSGLPPASQIDPQADYVAVYRTTDGGALPLLIPGVGNAVWTIPLNDYLKNGYIDTTLDTGLNAEITGAQLGENTPPALGAINLSLHLGRLWYSIGNVVYWTSGPVDPSGNGLNGTSPFNFSQMPSLVKRLVPTAIGMLVYCISDVYLIPGQGTTNNPIQPGAPYLPGVGLLSYNALDMCGTIMGLLTTDGAFMMIDPGGGFIDAGQPIGNNLAYPQPNEPLGKNFNPKLAYVAWYVNGEDQGWFLGDGETGWYRLCSTPSPETGYSWSPYAQILGGTHASPTIKAVQNIEVQPGTKRLLTGPYGVGTILNRSSQVAGSFVDGTSTAYRAFADIGSLVLTNPGSEAGVMFITTECVRLGNPHVLGVLFDEAEPYTTVPFDILRAWVSDPVNQPKSRSILAQRFYVSDDPDLVARCRNMQLRIDWSSDVVQSELFTYTVYGAMFAEG